MGQPFFASVGEGAGKMGFAGRGVAPGAAASEFRGEVEPDILEILLREGESVARVGEEDVAAVLVDGHVGVLAAFEVGQLRGVVALDPAGFVDRDRLPAAGGVVLVFEPILDDFELERAHRADDLAAVEGADEQLRHALVHELVHAFGELLEFQRVGVLDIAELFGGERRDAREFELFAFGEGVADLEVARVVQAHDVARIGEVDDRLLLGHEGRRRREFELLAAAHMQVVFVAFERARTYFEECDAVAVVGIHVGVDLEDEARHFGFRRLHDAGFGRGRARRGGYAHEAFEQLAHAEVVDRRTEEYRGQFAPQVGPAVEIVVNALDQLDVRAQLGREFVADLGLQLRRGEVRDFDGRGVGRELLVGGEEREVFLVEVVYALERGAVRDRERQRPHADVELLFDLVQQVERLLRGAVELVDEDDYRGRAHAADLHQLARLRLDALGAVDDDDDRIDGRQRAEGVLGEVFVARSVENVDLRALVFEAHYGRGDRDSALAFDLHEVRSGALLDLVALDGPGDVDGAAEEEQFLGKGGFTRVGVGDDREGAAACDLFL